MLLHFIFVSFLIHCQDFLARLAHNGIFKRYNSQWENIYTFTYTLTQLIGRKLHFATIWDVTTLHVATLHSVLNLSNTFARER
jgi:hypothetical protein